MPEQPQSHTPNLVHATRDPQNCTPTGQKSRKKENSLVLSNQYVAFFKFGLWKKPRLLFVSWRFIKWESLLRLLWGCDPEVFPAILAFGYVSPSDVPKRGGEEETGGRGTAFRTSFKFLGETRPWECGAQIWQQQQQQRESFSHADGWSRMGILPGASSWAWTWGSWSSSSCTCWVRPGRSCRPEPPWSTRSGKKNEGKREMIRDMFCRWKKCWTSCCLLCRILYLVTFAAEVMLTWEEKMKLENFRQREEKKPFLQYE